MQKLQKYQPKITVFNGKGIYEVFNACFGKNNATVSNSKCLCFDLNDIFLFISAFQHAISALLNFLLHFRRREKGQI